MPLEHRKNAEALRRNIRALMGEVGKSPHVASRKQALAIAFETQRRAKRADGGGLDALRAAMTSPIARDDRLRGMNDAVEISRALGREEPAWEPSEMKGLGRRFYSVPWEYRERTEPVYRAARGGGLHSPVPGRTDHLPLDVKSGSYVIPADIVSAFGEGNSLAGMAKLDKQFKQGPYGAGKSGPYGAMMLKIGGARVPKAPPRPKLSRMGVMKMRRRAAGGDTPDVPIAAAGGEYIVSPEAVAALGSGDISRGHDILDEVVRQERRALITTLRGLPDPARG